MALKGLPTDPANRARGDEPQDRELPADYLRWISFEGSISLSTGPAGKPKLPITPEAERVRAGEAQARALQGDE